MSPQGGNADRGERPIGTYQRIGRLSLNSPHEFTCFFCNRTHHVGSIAPWERHDFIRFSLVKHLTVANIACWILSPSILWPVSFPVSRVPLKRNAPTFRPFLCERVRSISGTV